jgi:hypothetical protein
MSGDDHVKARLTPEGRFAILLLPCMFVTFAVFTFSHQPERGLGTSESLACFLIALRATWSLKKNGWYLLAAVIAAAMQIPFILFVPWANRDYGRAALMLFGFLDFFLVWGFIKLFEKLFSRDQSEHRHVS